MKALWATGWRPHYRDTSRNAVDYNIKEATDRSTQPEDDELNDRVINIHYDRDLRVDADLDTLTL